MYWSSTIGIKRPYKKARKKENLNLILNDVRCVASADKNMAAHNRSLIWWIKVSLNLSPRKCLFSSHAYNKVFTVDNFCGALQRTLVSNWFVWKTYIYNSNWIFWRISNKAQLFHEGSLNFALFWYFCVRVFKRSTGAKVKFKCTAACSHACANFSSISDISDFEEKSLSLHFFWHFFQLPTDCDNCLYMP